MSSDQLLPRCRSHFDRFFPSNVHQHLWDQSPLWRGHGTCNASKSHVQWGVFERCQDYSDIASFAIDTHLLSLLPEIARVRCKLSCHDLPCSLCPRATVHNAYNHLQPTACKHNCITNLKIVTGNVHWFRIKQIGCRTLASEQPDPHPLH